MRRGRNRESAGERAQRQRERQTRRSQVRGPLPVRPSDMSYMYDALVVITGVFRGPHTITGLSGKRVPRCMLMADVSKNLSNTELIQEIA